MDLSYQKDRQTERQTDKIINTHKNKRTLCTHYIHIIPTDFMFLTILLVQLIHCWRNMYWLLCTRIQKLGRDNSRSMARQ